KRPVDRHLRRTLRRVRRAPAEELSRAWLMAELGDAAPHGAENPAPRPIASSGIGGCVAVADRVDLLVIERMTRVEPDSVESRSPRAVGRRERVARRRLTATRASTALVI